MPDVGPRVLGLPPRIKLNTKELSRALVIELSKTDSSPKGGHVKDSGKSTFRLWWSGHCCW